MLLLSKEEFNLMEFFKVYLQLSMVIRIYIWRQCIVFYNAKCFALYDIYRHECI